MTSEEVEKNCGKIVKVKSEGLAQGFRYERILDYDLNEKTAWGKGTVRVKDPFAKSSRKSQPVKFALSQIELYYSTNTRMRRRKIKNDNIRKRKRK